jgi:hypothetical protein
MGSPHIRQAAFEPFSHPIPFPKGEAEQSLMTDRKAVEALCR